MKKVITAFLVLVAGSTFLLANEKYDDVDWDQFSSNIEVALESENTGLRQAAIVMMYKYTEYLNVRNGVQQVMKEFKSNPNTETRKLALVTLYKMHDDWAVELLKTYNQLEKDEEIKDTVNSIVTAIELKDEIKATKMATQIYNNLAFNN